MGTREPSAEGESNKTGATVSAERGRGKRAGEPRAFGSPERVSRWPDERAAILLAPRGPSQVNRQPGKVS